MLMRGSVSRKIPHSRIFINDELYFVEKGENKAYYHAEVTNSNFYSKLTSEEIENLVTKHENNLKLTEPEEKKWKKKCITIIEFNNLEKIEGIDIPNYTALEDWLMINDLNELQNR